MFQTHWNPSGHDIFNIEVEVEVRFKGAVEKVLRGRCVDMISGKMKRVALRFNREVSIKQDCSLKIFLNWPAWLDNAKPLSFVIFDGKISEWKGDRAIINFEEYGYKTQAVARLKIMPKAS